MVDGVIEDLRGGVLEAPHLVGVERANPADPDRDPLPGLVLVQAAAPEPIPQAPQPVVGRASLPMPLEDAADDECLEQAVGRGGRDAERIYDIAIAGLAPAGSHRP